MESSVILSIILPTYNEGQNLVVFIPDIEHLFLSLSIEIIIIDDNSNDGTDAIIKDLQDKYSNILFIKRTNTRGLGSALRVGYELARGTYILSSDSDLSFSAADMMRLYSQIRKGYDMVLGFKVDPGDSRKNYIKLSISLIGNALARIFSKAPYKNFSTNFRIFKSEVWQKLDIVENSHSFLCETVLKAHDAQFSISEIPVTFFDRKFGQSKLSFFREAPRFCITLYKHGFMR